MTKMSTSVITYHYRGYCCCWNLPLMFLKKRKRFLSY